MASTPKRHAKRRLNSNRRRSDDRGRVGCNLRGPVTAGSYVTCEVTYTAGFAGIDDTGSLKLVARYPTDAGTPQFDDPAAPNYTTARASNGADLQLRYDTKDNVRPWGKTLHIRVVKGFLRRGDRITITLGDRSGGSPGWQMQTFVQKRFELRMLVDRYATYVFEQVPGRTAFRIVASAPCRLVAVAPSLVKPARPFTIRTRLEDVWGNPVGRPGRIRHPGFPTPGVYRIPVTNDEYGLETETNPIVVRDGDGYGRYWADLHGQSEETIGTNSIEDYFRFARDWGFLDICGHQGNDFQITDAFWEKIQQTTSRFDRPGRFVAFPGWEWSGNTGLGGDRNVFFLHEGGPIHRSSRALLELQEAQEETCETVEDLFQTLSECGREVMLVPHVGGRYADLARHDERLEPVVEVHSAWGTFEWMLADAFRHGYRVGIVANSDGHKGRPGASHPGASTFGSYGGLTCVLAQRLDRTSVWEAYRSRRVYATTGARIHLDVDWKIDGQMHPMGAVVHSKAVPTLTLAVDATADIERVEIRNGMEVIRTLRPYSRNELTDRVKLLWQGAEVRGRGRQVVWDGFLQLSGNRIRDIRPINFHNARKPCRQVSPTRVEWESVTTGGVAGVILSLQRKSAGHITVETMPRRFRRSLRTLGIGGASYEAGGLGKRISIYPLPAPGGRLQLRTEWTLPVESLHRGDNPLYVHVVQEDGHMAWSSPLYLVRN